MKEYAIYKGDDMLAMGTLEQCASELKIKPKSVSFYATPAYLKRTTDKTARRLVDLGDYDE